MKANDRHHIFSCVLENLKRAKFNFEKNWYEQVPKKGPTSKTTLSYQKLVSDEPLS